MTADASDRLDARLVAELYRQIPIIAVGLVVVFSLCAVTYWSYLPTWVKAVWAALFGLHMWPRLAFYAAYRRDPKRYSPAAWEQIFVLMSIVLGICWSWFSVSVVLLAPPEVSTVALIVVTGIVSASVATTSASPTAFIGIGASAMVPLSAVLLTQQNSVYIATGSCAIVFLLVMAHSSRRIHSNIRKSIAYGFENEELVRQLGVLSAEDSLTGLSNRRALDQGFDAIWARASREGRGVGMVLCDIDCFKQFNDALGHQAGDRCLKHVAGVIARSIRQSDAIVARYGGEEFAVVLPDCKADELGTVAERLRLAVRDAMIDHPASPVAPYVTISAGAAYIQATLGTPSSSVFAAADAALYRAKSAGKNCVRTHDSWHQCPTAA